MQARFIDYWRAGFRRIIPITPPGCEVSPRSTLHRRAKDIGKAPGIRGQDGLWRSFNWMAHETTEADLDRWGAMGAGVGLKLGAGLVAVDIDSLDKTIVLQVIRLAREMLGAAQVRIGAYPKSALLFACAEDVPYQRVEFTGAGGAQERVEILGEGRQIVVHGIHPRTGKPYQWFDSSGNAIEYPSFPTIAITAEQLDAFCQRLSETLPAATPPAKASDTSAAPRDQEALRGDPELVAEAVRALPNTSALFPTYDDYMRVGYAIKAALPDDPAMAEALFVEWAMKWDGRGEEHTPERIAGDLKRAKPPYRVGAGWLYDHAAQHGQFNPAKAYFDVIEEAPPNPGRFQFITHDEAAAQARSQSAKPLIKGLLDQGAMSVVYGPSNVGKSFVLLDASWHIAMGRPWGGMRTTRRAVAYIAAEGGGGVAKRLEALLRKYGSAGAMLRLLAASVDLLRPQADLKDLIAALQAIPELGLVIVDTTSRALAGGDENSSVDMGAFIRNCDALRKATGAHLLLVHHSGKDETRGARGWSGVRAAIDTEIEVREGVIEVKKQRDLDKSWASGFVLEGVHLWNDTDGDAVTSATVRLTSREDAAAVLAGERGLPEIRSAILQALVDDTAQNTARLIADRMADAGTIGDVTSDKVSSELTRMHRDRLLARRGGGGKKTPYTYWKTQTYVECMDTDSEMLAGKVAGKLSPHPRTEGINDAGNIFH